MILSVVVPSLKNHPYFSGKLSPKAAAVMAKTESTIKKTIRIRRILFIILSIMVMNAALIYIAIATRVIWYQVKSLAIGVENKEAVYEGRLAVAELQDLKKSVTTFDGKMVNVTGLASNSALKAINSLVFGYDYSNVMMFGSTMFGILMMFVAFLLCMPGFGIIPVLGTVVKAGRIRCAFLISPVWAALVVATALLRFIPTLYSVLLMTAAVALAFATLKLLYNKGKKQIEKEEKMLKQIGNVIEQIKDGKSFDEIDFKGKG
jgi:hypothetical protein